MRQVWFIKGLLDCAMTAIEQFERVSANYRRIFAGVNIPDPLSTWIDTTVQIEPGATIEPNVQLLGDTRIGIGTRVTSGSRILDSAIGRDCIIRHSFIEKSRVGDKVQVGPCAHIRGESTIGDGCGIGNFAEINRSTLGEGVKEFHFSYLGDAKVGAHANIAAGAITANFDGKRKHQTIIGEGAFIGSDAVLIAPITVGKKAVVGAGAVVRRDKNLPPTTIDVPDGKTAVGVPARILGQGN